MTSRVPRDLTLARRFAEIADQLKWSLQEQYVADSDCVLKGGNEIVSFYVRPTAAEAEQLAKGLEALVGPLRRASVITLLDQLDALSAEIRQEQQERK